MGETFVHLPAYKLLKLCHNLEESGYCLKKKKNQLPGNEQSSLVTTETQYRVLTTLLVPAFLAAHSGGSGLCVQHSVKTSGLRGWRLTLVHTGPHSWGGPGGPSRQHLRTAALRGPLSSCENCRRPGPTTQGGRAWPEATRGSRQS